MANYNDTRTMDPGPGGGGSGWERNMHNADVATATPVFNQTTGQWEWRMPDGSLLNGSRTSVTTGNSNYGPYAGGYRFDPSQGVPSSLDSGMEDGGSPWGPWAALPSYNPIADPTGVRVPEVSPSRITTSLGGGGSASGGGGGGGNGAGIPNWARAATVAAPAVANRVLGGGSSQLSPEIQQLLALAMKRITDQEPLFQAVNRQALAGLPTSYQR